MAEFYYRIFSINTRYSKIDTILAGIHESAVIEIHLLSKNRKHVDHMWIIWGPLEFHFFLNIRFIPVKETVNEPSLLHGTKATNRSNIANTRNFIIIALLKTYFLQNKWKNAEKKEVILLLANFNGNILFKIFWNRYFPCLLFQSL